MNDSKQLNPPEFYLKYIAWDMKTIAQCMRDILAELKVGKEGKKLYEEKDLY